MKNFWVDNPRMAKLFGLAENKLPTRTPVVVFDSAPLAIGFDQTDVATRIAAEGVALDGCAAQLRDGSGIRATLFVTGGKVTRVDSEAMTREQGEEGLACVKEVLGRVSFPAADGRIVYTLGVNRR